MSSAFLAKINKELNRIPKRLVRQILYSTLRIIESAQSRFMTYHARPMRAAEVGILSNKLIITSPTAIVIQGPIIKDKDFTLETIKTYKKTFTDALIVLSTWEDEDWNHLENFKSEGIEIVLNKKPENFGQSNINLQLVSSYNGLLHAKKLGAEYALKVRTDQRMYGVNNLQFLINILEKFPVASGYKQKKRILGVSLNTFIYRLYGLSDMTVFGDIEDMLVYWGAKLDSRAAVKADYATTREFCMAKVCEVYLATEFLASIGRPLQWTLKDSWQVFADHFCVIDKESLDIYWYKYDRYREHRKLEYNAFKMLTEMTFKDWLNIHSAFSMGQSNFLDIPEQVLELGGESEFNA